MTRQTDPIDSAPAPALPEIARLQLSRRDVLKASLAALAMGLPESARPVCADERVPSSLGFREIDATIRASHAVAPGYQAHVLIRWGDPVLAGSPPFDPSALSAAAQERQFGYNCDFVAFLPLPFGSGSSARGLLCVNHEYCSCQLMWRDVGYGGRLTRDQVEVEIAATGLSIVEIERTPAGWRVVAESAHARRLTSRTPMRVGGPAAGHARLRTAADPSGTLVMGTVNNCAGGVTPWGTVLTAEENFNKYSVGDPAACNERRSLERYGFGDPEYRWGDHEERFDIARHPHEANRFGWVVELDPTDPASVPVKRTALGRLKHEGASVVANADGRAVVYMGDDERFDYVYRFVSRGRIDPTDRAANRDLLENGTLAVACFVGDGTLEWRSLEWGSGPLTPANGFASQADVLIDARLAAEALGGTPMDRPEDIEVDPITGAVYCLLTNNTKRKAPGVDPANPRANNAFGHVIELVPPMRDGKPDHAAASYRWSMLLRGGNPAVPAHEAMYHAETTANGWIACPDNAAFDAAGRLWIATDQGEKQAVNQRPDGLWACDVRGEGRALTRLFFAGPRGAELCGPCFTPDGTAMFVAVQHPGEEEGSTFVTPSTRWPDFDMGLPPRPAVVAITREDRGVIGDA